MGMAGRRAASMALVGLLVAGLGACGGDDDDTADEGGNSTTSSAPAEEATGGDVDAFCENFIAIDEAVAGAPQDPAELEAYLNDTVMPVAQPFRLLAPFDDAVGLAPPVIRHCVVADCIKGCAQSPV